jgi:hydroxyacylglutathione hydrolase
MLQVKSFICNPFSENTYVVYDEVSKAAIIIDPGMYTPAEEKMVFDFIAEKQLQPSMVLNTHCHLDHVFGVHACVEKYNIPFGFHTLEQQVYDWAQAAGLRYGVPVHHIVKPNFFITEKQKIQIGTAELIVQFTPGHSPGHIILVNEAQQFAIVADVIFASSIGRTDLPGGNLETLIHSIQTQILSLPNETILYTGHGPSTTVGIEKMNNPYIANR